MTDIASVLSILFVLLIAFYVCVHTALTISEVKSADDAILPPFQSAWPE